MVFLLALCNSWNFVAKVFTRQRVFLGVSSQIESFALSDKDFFWRKKVFKKMFFSFLGKPQKDILYFQRRYWATKFQLMSHFYSQQHSYNPTSDLYQGPELMVRTARTMCTNTTTNNFPTWACKNLKIFPFFHAHELPNPEMGQLFLNHQKTKMERECLKITW